MSNTEIQYSNFSLISRLFGNLFYRSPTDPILAATFNWLQQKGLSAIWALDCDKQAEQALQDVQLPINLSSLEKEYQRLFGNTALIKSTISSYGIDLNDFIHFRQERGMPLAAEATPESLDHFAVLLLTAAWIEDNLDSTLAQKILFERFLLPCATKFLSQVENHASLPFYRAVALLTKDILAAMADELEENEESL